MPNEGKNNSPRPVRGTGLETREGEISGVAAWINKMIADKEAFVKFGKEDGKKFVRILKNDGTTLLFKFLE